MKKCGPNPISAFYLIRKDYDEFMKNYQEFQELINDSLKSLKSSGETWYNFIVGQAWNIGGFIINLIISFTSGFVYLIKKASTYFSSAISYLIPSPGTLGRLSIYGMLVTLFLAAASPIIAGPLVLLEEFSFDRFFWVLEVLLLHFKEFQYLKIKTFYLKTHKKFFSQCLKIGVFKSYTFFENFIREKDFAKLSRNLQLKLSTNIFNFSKNFPFAKLPNNDKNF